MAPEVPEEVDVFTVPHSRMKELVHKYLDMVTSTNFTDVVKVQTLLENLCNTFHEFRAHERIENKYIMRKLKLKLRSLSITNTAVCNCHSDNKLSEMLQLVRSGYAVSCKSARERINYGLQLRKALEEFTQQFLPHMEEEEEVFQPMLIKYFTYEELKEIKAKVIQQHQAQHADTSAATATSLAEKCVEDALSSESSDEEQYVGSIPQRAGFHSLPNEIYLRVFSLLSPRDLARCAQVSTRWNSLALDPSLWTQLLPVHWAQGIWTFDPSTKLSTDNEHAGSEDEKHSFVFDEDADVDESECQEETDPQYRQAQEEWRVLTGLSKHLLSRVGGGVSLCVLSHSTGLTNRLMQEILKACPNLEHLDVSYTTISDAAFKGLREGSCCKLRHLDLTGCVNITNVSLARLAPALLCPRLCTQASHPEEISLVSNSFPYNELKKWLLCDSLLSDLINADDEDNDEKDMKVSKASLTHSNSSDYRQLLFQVRQHFEKENEKDNECFEKCKEDDGLRFLSLSGCYHITDTGLRSLATGGCGRYLKVLDLSGCVEITAPGLQTLVSQCPNLDLAQLFYCDNMVDDPYSLSASGCQNLECSSRFCCRLGD